MKLERRPTGSPYFKFLSKLEWTILVLIVVYSFIPNVAGLLRVAELAGGPAIIPENPRVLADPFPVVIHIVSSFVFCLVGAIQFLPSIRRHRPAAHRMLGRLVATAGCLSAASGLWMAHTYAFPDALQGALLYWVRMVLGTLMIAFIICAINAIRSGNIARHRASMLRAYAIGQGASTQAVLGIAWIIGFGAEPLGPLRDGLMVAAWAINLLAAQVLIARLRAPEKHAANPTVA